jgi:hypothetical protein
MTDEEKARLLKDFKEGKLKPDPTIWDRIPQDFIDETLHAIATEDPRNFKPYSQFRAEVLAKVAAMKRTGELPD